MRRLLFGDIFGKFLLDSLHELLIQGKHFVVKAVHSLAVPANKKLGKVPRHVRFGALGHVETAWRAVIKPLGCIWFLPLGTSRAAFLLVFQTWSWRLQCLDIDGRFKRGVP